MLTVRETHEFILGEGDSAIRVRVVTDGSGKPIAVSSTTVEDVEDPSSQAGPVSDILRVAEALRVRYYRHLPHVCADHGVTEAWPCPECSPPKVAIETPVASIVPITSRGDAA